LTVYVNKDPSYIADDYIATGYVGTDADLYVAAGYVSGVALGEANLSSTASLTVTATNIRPGAATLSASASTSASADRTRTTGADLLGSFTVTAGANTQFNGSASLVMTGDEVQWQNAQTWGNARSQIWGPLFSATAIRVLTGVANLSSSFVLSATGQNTAIGNIVVTGFGSLTASALRTRSSSSSLSASFTTTQSGTTVITGTANLTAFATTVSVGIRRVDGDPADINANFALTASAERTRSTTASLSSSATLTASGNFNIRASANLSASFTLQAITGAIASGVIISAGTFTTTQSAVRIRGVEADLNANFSLTGTGGASFLAECNITAFTTIVGTLSIYSIDPFRIYQVDSESRALEIVEEPRIYTVDFETRINTIESETRNFSVPSETRTLEIQHLTLVDVENTPVDRRE
jgi:hypothetical protein